MRTTGAPDLLLPCRYTMDSAPVSILIVDDEPGIRAALTASLHTRGYSVEIATNGMEAMAANEAHSPSVIILDLGLPDFDGVEICRQLRERSNVPIIVLTAEGSEDRKIAAFD